MECCVMKIKINATKATATVLKRLKDACGDYCWPKNMSM